MEYRYFQPDIETMDRERMRELQGRKLHELVEWTYSRVEHYRRKMDAMGVKPDDIQTIDDIAKLPFTTKADLRDTYPTGMFAVPNTEMERIHASSGTTGNPTVVGYTKGDIESWSESVARCLVGAGATKDSVLQVSYGYGLFTGGLGLHYGGEYLGATVIPTSTGNTARQIRLMKDLGTTHLACTPSYALYLAEAIEEAGLSMEQFKLTDGVFGGEPWTLNMRREIERRLHIKAHDIYGLSEISGPGVSCECDAQMGLHVQEDHFYPEIIDPETGEVLPPGEKGELVFTTLSKRGLPLIRYRTRDITRLLYDRCECGRTTVRMEKPDGRSDDMLIIRGVNVFPSQIESALLEIGEVNPYYMLTVDRVNNLDTLDIDVEMSETMFSDEVRRVEDIEKKIRQKIESTIGISAKIHLVEQKSLKRTEGKASRVIDKRHLT